LKRAQNSPLNNYFDREFIFDEEQKETLLSLYRELEPEMERAKVYNGRGRNGETDETRDCTNVPFHYKKFPDISLELKNFLSDLDPDHPDDLWFAQFEFIKYEGIGQKFERHTDDRPGGVNHNRFYTSVTMIEKSEDLIGGKLKIWTPEEKEYVVDLEPFETVIFPAHYWHEATPLLQGRRVVLISWAQREGKVLTSR